MRVRHERKLAAISLGLVGAASVLISVLAGDQGFDDPLYALLVGPLFPIAMFILARRDVRREAPNARPLADDDQLEAPSTTRAREALFQGPLLVLVVLIGFEIGYGLFFGVSWLAMLAPVGAYLMTWADGWERHSKARLYRERGLFARTTRYVRAARAA